MSRVGILFSANVSRKKMSWCCLRTLVVIHLLIETCYVYFFDIRASFWVTVIWNYHYWWRKNFKICSVCTTIRPISNGNLRYRLFLWLLHVMWKTKQFGKKGFCGTLQVGQWKLQVTVKQQLHFSKVQFAELFYNALCTG